MNTYEVILADGNVKVIEGLAISDKYENGGCSIIGAKLEIVASIPNTAYVGICKVEEKLTEQQGKYIAKQFEENYK